MSAAETQVDEWLATEPGARLAMVFCPPAQRDTLRCWGTLLAHIDATRFDLAEPTVAHAKRAWWADELHHGGRGHARHPVLHALLQQPPAARVAADAWSRWGRALLADDLDESTPSDIETMLARYRRFATCVASIESELFGVEAPPDALAIDHWLQDVHGARARAPGAYSRWPLHLLARHQVVPGEMLSQPLAPAARSVVADTGQALVARVAQASWGSYWRRWCSARDLARLRRWSRGVVDASGPGPLAQLRLAWSAGRAARAMRA
jgi:hypothetical protein